MTLDLWHQVDFVPQATSVLMLPGQTDLKTMTISHPVIVYALQTLLEGNARKGSSARKVPTNLLPAQVGITVRVKERMQSLHSVIPDGFVQVELRCRGRLMELPGISAHKEVIAPRVRKSQGCAQ